MQALDRKERPEAGPPEAEGAHGRLGRGPSHDVAAHDDETRGHPQLQEAGREVPPRHEVGWASRRIWRATAGFILPGWAANPLSRRNVNR